MVELGLANLDRADATRVMELFLELLRLRVSRRLAHLLGTAGMSDVESALGFENSPHSFARGLAVLKESVPEYDQYVADELRRAKADFVARLTERIDASEYER